MPLTWIMTRLIHQPRIPSLCPTIRDLTHHRHIHNKGVNDGYTLGRRQGMGILAQGFLQAF